MQIPFKKAFSLTSIGLFSLLLSGCAANQGHSGSAQKIKPNATPSPREFIENFNEKVVPIAKESGKAQWVRATYITEDTAALAAKASERYQAFISKSVNDAKQYQGQPMDPETARALKILVSSSSMPSPNNAEKRAELSRIATDMEGIYGSGKYCLEGGECLQLQALERIIASSRDYDELLEIWEGWREVSVSLRPMYQRFVELTNEGANEFGYNNLAEMWKDNYDMSASEFDNVVENLWEQVEPLYEELHCYVRGELNEFYGDDRVPANGQIPAHLLGNMWSQTWNNIYDLVEPYPNHAAPDVTKTLVEKEYTAEQMTRTAEEFFTSLGLPKLPDLFWERSMLTQPKDRNVVCHASAWDLDAGKDVRIKQCVEPTEEQLSTLHHELGHVYYFLLYKDLDPLFRTGAHDGFHEAIGDTIVLSMTPNHLKKKDLIKEVPQGDQAKINQQMRMALEKIAFLPFSRLMDEWRWKVFNGEIKPENYNAAWWDLREKYQGLSAPSSINKERGEHFFDPGAKYHIPGNTPYIRYFLSFIIQFQFHKALCDTVGFEGQLSDCSIYGSQEAGERLSDVLAMGASKPWPEAMQAMTGQRSMDASALIEYFQPLLKWLTEENSERQCGW